MAQTKSPLRGADALEISHAHRVRADCQEPRPQLLVRARLHSNGLRCLMETLHLLKRFDGVFDLVAIDEVGMIRAEPDSVVYMLPLCRRHLATVATAPTARSGCRYMRGLSDKRNALRRLLARSHRRPAAVFEGAEVTCAQCHSALCSFTEFISATHRFY